MKKIVVLILIIPLFFACKNKQNDAAAYTINGKLTENYSGKVFIQIVNGEQTKLDTINVNEGKFTYENKSTETLLALLFYSKSNTNNRNEYLFFIEPNATINISIDSFQTKNYTVSGSASNDEFFKFEKEKLSSINSKEKMLFEKINPANIDNQETMDSLIKMADSYSSERKNVIIQYLQTHPNSIAIEAYSYYINSTANDIDFFNKVYNSLGATTKNTVYGKSILEQIASVGNNIVGAVVNDFIALDVNDNKVTLSNIYKNNKYVLIDFWSSNCVPCRKENPNLVSLYKQYKNQGFDIVGVSVDSNKQNWINAIKTDKLSWTNVSDLKGWESNIAKLYNVTATPTNFLIDNKGNIIEMNLRAEDLQNKLKELFKK